MLNATTKNALEILKSDHNKVKDLFHQFEETQDPSSRKGIATTCLEELKVHATVEEELFYPVVRQQLGEEQDLVNEAEEEHHVAKILISELEGMRGDEEHYEAKFKVLIENVLHHVKEEEGQIFPKIHASTIDLEDLGEKLSQRKEILTAEGVPHEEALAMAGESTRGEKTSSSKKQTVHRAKKSRHH
jgi:hemerythrin superfamily protein